MGDSKLISTTMIILAFGLMLHASFSTVHFKDVIESSGVKSTLLLTSNEHLIPMDVYVEVALCFILALVGVLMHAEPFVSFTGGDDLSKLSWTKNVATHEDFMILNNRAKYLQKRLLKSTF